MIEFTGERFVPTESGELAYEHWHRYAWCREVVKGRKVLDIACGEGYGSALLAATAAEVSGVDISPQAVKHARKTYRKIKNLNYHVASAVSVPFESNSFDVVVSFETIEHLLEQEEMLAELRRVLKPDGIMIMSSPNRAVYSDGRDYVNEFHVRELYFNEFEALLAREFPAVQYYGQRMTSGSMVLPMDGCRDAYEAFTSGMKDGDVVERTVEPDQIMYFLAVCAAERLLIPEMPASLYVDGSVDLYARHEQIARWGQSLDKELAETRALVSSLQREHEEVVVWAKQLDAELDQLAQAHSALQGEHQERSEWALGLDRDRERLWAQHAQLQLELGEREEWIQALKLEVSGLRDREEVLSSLLEERTQWAQELDSEKERVKGDYVSARLEADEYAALVHSLQQKVSELHTALEQSAQRAQELEEEKERAKNDFVAVRAEADGLSEWVQSLQQNVSELHTALEKSAKWAQELEEEKERAKNDFVAVRAEADGLSEWAQSLQKESEKRAERNDELNDLVEQRTRWCHELELQCERERLEILRIHAEFEERTVWAVSVQEANQCLHRRIRELEQELEKRTQWAHELEQEREKALGDVSWLRSDLEEHTCQVERLQDTVEQLHAELAVKDREYAKLDERYGIIDAAFRGAVKAKEDREVEMEELGWRIQQDLDSLRAEMELSRESIEGRLEAMSDEHNAHRVESSELQHYRATIRDLEHRLNLVVGSKSWALTRPLRFLGRVLRGDWTAVESSLRKAPFVSVAALAPLKGLAKRFFAHKQALMPAPAPALVAMEVLGDIGAAVLSLRFPYYDNPQVSILIPTYGNLACTVTCLKSIVDHPPTVSYEVLVAEDASGDEDMAVLAGVPGLRYYENHQNLGFLRSCNELAARSCGEFVYFLNNDTEVTAGWLDAMVAVFERADAGLVGSKLIYPDGRLQEAGGIVWADGSAWNFGRLDNPQRPQFSYLKEADYVSGASIMLRKSVFNSLGGFDELYAPAYYEDTDIAFRVRAHGLKVFMEPASVVIHYEGVSSGTDESAGVKAYQAINREKFLDRWRDVLCNEHFPNAENVFLARDRSKGRKHVLVVDHYVPQPDRDAGSRATWQVVQLLMQEGVQVSFWPENLHYDPDYAPKLQQLGVEVLYGGEHWGNFEAWIAENGRYLDAVILNRPHVSVNFVDAIRKYSAAKVVYYGHDVHHLRMQEQMKLLPDPALSAEMERFKSWEHEMWLKSDVVLYPSESETAHVRNWLQENDGETSLAETIPLYAYEPVSGELVNPPEDRQGILFVAGFAHPPNVDAAHWFVQDVLPLVREQLPGVQVTLVGSNPHPSVQALARDGVEVTGYVSDERLAEYYRHSRVSVAPLRFGGGVKGKVLESLRFGVPCVTTSTGMQGLGEAWQFMPVADDPEGMAEHLVSLLRDDERWRKVSVSEMAFIDCCYSRDALWRVLSAAINPALAAA